MMPSRCGKRETGANQVCSDGKLCLLPQGGTWQGKGRKTWGWVGGREIDPTGHVDTCVHLMSMSFNLAGELDAFTLVVV